MAKGGKKKPMPKNMPKGGKAMGMVKGMPMGKAVKAKAWKPSGKC